MAQVRLDDLEDALGSPDLEDIERFSRSLVQVGAPLVQPPPPCPPCPP